MPFESKPGAPTKLRGSQTAQQLLSACVTEMLQKDVTEVTIDVTLEDGTHGVFAIRLDMVDGKPALLGISEQEAVDAALAVFMAEARIDPSVADMPTLQRAMRRALQEGKDGAA